MKLHSRRCCDPKFTPSPAQRRLVESGRLGRKSGQGWYAYGEDASARQPHTAPPAKPPTEVTVHGSLGPAAALVDLISDAGILVLPGAGDPTRGRLQLPDGTGLYLTDGHPATHPGADTPRVAFDLALDYRAATRIAIAPCDLTPPESVAAASGLFQAIGKQVSVIDDIPGLIVARTVAMLVDFAADAVAKGVASPSDVDIAMRLGVNYPLGPLAWGDRLTAAWVWDLLGSLSLAYPTGRYACSSLLRRRMVTERSLLDE